MMWVRPQNKNSSWPEQRLSTDLKKGHCKSLFNLRFPQSFAIELHSFSFLIEKAQPSNREYSKQVSFSLLNITLLYCCCHSKPFLDSNLWFPRECSVSFVIRFMAPLLSKVTIVNIQIKYLKRNCSYFRSSCVGIAVFHRVLVASFRK